MWCNLGASPLSALVTYNESPTIFFQLVHLSSCVHLYVMSGSSDSSKSSHAIFEMRQTADFAAILEPITIRPGMSVKSSKSLSKHHTQLLKNPKVRPNRITQQTSSDLFRSTTNYDHLIGKVHVKLSPLSGLCVLLY